ncbi:helix-turn-helix domain-containing protein [Ochrobactrum sp. CGA5]|uniref:helix-turn-helix domain-containing protein n=1 Tax=Ochrobactrum sp. CGA5 TaxID=2583453 RepID=UPI001FFFD0AC|nr:helix-turn-helix domain-containing protein [Ochrobactrum sp. CGA5]
MSINQLSTLSFTPIENGGNRAPRMVVAGVSSTQKYLPAGFGVYAEGEKCDALYKVASGGVRIFRLLADGRRQISAFCLPGEMFGFESGTTHHFFAETLCNTVISCWPAVSTSRTLDADLLTMAIQALVRAQEHLLVLGRQDATQRIAAFFLEMAERQDELEHVELPMSRNDIADYLGLSLETVSRTFSRLKCKGDIRLLSLRRVELVNRRHLEKLAA